MIQERMNTFDTVVCIEYKMYKLVCIRRYSLKTYRQKQPVSKISPLSPKSCSPLLSLSHPILLVSLHPLTCMYWIVLIDTTCIHRLQHVSSISHLSTPNLARRFFLSQSRSPLSSTLIVYISNTTCIHLDYVQHLSSLSQISLASLLSLPISFISHLPLIVAMSRNQTNNSY